MSFIYLFSCAATSLPASFSGRSQVFIPVVTSGVLTIAELTPLLEESVANAPIMLTKL